MMQVHKLTLELDNTTTGSGCRLLHN